jgi:hypothetical protein
MIIRLTHAQMKTFPSFYFLLPQSNAKCVGVFFREYMNHEKLERHEQDKSFFVIFVPFVVKRIRIT